MCGGCKCKLAKTYFFLSNDIESICFDPVVCMHVCSRNLSLGNLLCLGAKRKRKKENNFGAKKPFDVASFYYRLFLCRFFKRSYKCRMGKSSVEILLSLWHVFFYFFFILPSMPLSGK
jgi:hypothetical protein